jgi:hypothetical protein
MLRERCYARFFVVYRSTVFLPHGHRPQGIYVRITYPSLYLRVLPDRTSIISDGAAAKQRICSRPRVLSSPDPTSLKTTMSWGQPLSANTPAFLVGPWKVQSASHKTTNKRVSVWTFDKKSSELEKMGPAGKERTLEVLKSEVRATSLHRLLWIVVFMLSVCRLHPCRD